VVDPADIAAVVAELGQPAYRGRQVYEALTRRLVTDFDEITSLPVGVRRRLSVRLSAVSLREVLTQTSHGARKALFLTADGHQVEAVLMKHARRATVCVSTQVGCAVGCAFCASGRLGLSRGLSAEEMMDQVLHFARVLRAESRSVTNVVFMGMGEPLDNLPEVLRAVRVMTHREGLRVAPRRTTLSTVGLVDRLPEVVASATGVSIALSLCATTDEVRNEVVPAARRHGDLRTVMDTLAGLTLPHGHVYTIEYTLIAGVGDSLDDARRLSRMLARFPHKVNLIPFNPWPGSPFRRPDDAAVEAFRQFLADRHHPVTVRRSRGQDIGAACGQLELAAHPQEVAP